MQDAVAAAAPAAGDEPGLDPEGAEDLLTLTAGDAALLPRDTEQLTAARGSRLHAVLLALLGSLVGAAALRSGGSGLRRAAPATSAPAEALAAVQRLHSGASCAAEGKDCRSSKCCQQENQTCFEKNGFWASCLDSCVPGVHGEDVDQSPWSCRMLGEQPHHGHSCSWPEEDCSGTGGCCQRGWTCAVKAPPVALCTQVEQGPWTADGAPAKKLPIPAGWTGEVLGGWRSEFEVAPAARAKAAGLSLFCFAAVLPGSPEVRLMELARERQAGIFGCNASAIFNASRSRMHKWDTGVSTLVNTEAFLKVWSEVKDDGRYLLHDWVVKADADCIFFPARLRHHLRELRAPAEAKVYVKNTVQRFLGGGFLGAIEILSTAAVTAFLTNVTECSRFIGTMSGEDGFLKDCLDALDVGYMHDELMMHPSDNPIECQVSEFAAYHPMKTPANWEFCYNLATRAVHPPELIQQLVDLLPEQLQWKYGKRLHEKERAVKDLGKAILTFK